MEAPDSRTRSLLAPAPLRALPTGEQPLLPGVPQADPQDRVHPLAGQLLAGIDVGSNAMRLKIARVTSSGGLITVIDHREAVRLGADAFRNRVIGNKTLEDAVVAFRRFRGLLDAYPVDQMRAVATSALREAENSLAIIDRLQDEAGIQIEVISSLEEAELVVRAVTRVAENPSGNLLTVDVGGGSVEISVVERGRLVAIEGFSVGTVRMLQYLGDQTSDEREYPHLIQAHISFMRNRIERLLREHTVEQVVAIGGNASTLAQLANTGLGTEVDETRDDPSQLRLSDRQLDDLIELIDSLATAQRKVLLGLADRRADVIQPAAYLYSAVLKASGLSELVVPGVGVRDGLLWQMIDPHLAPLLLTSPAEQISQMARDIVERYRADPTHADQVAWLADRLFVDLADLHRLGEQDRNLLTAAALLHDVGHLVNHGKHHIHTYYLIRNADFYGLTNREQEIVALVARFHRKGDPSADRHPEFAALSHQERVRVTKLAALLRVADALDRAHAMVVTTLAATVEPERVVLTIAGPTDMNIERWALRKGAGLFERVFLTKIQLKASEEIIDG